LNQGCGGGNIGYIAIEDPGGKINNFDDVSYMMGLLDGVKEMTKGNPATLSISDLQVDENKEPIFIANMQKDEKLPGPPGNWMSAELRYSTQIGRDKINVGVENYWMGTNGYINDDKIMDDVAYMVFEKGSDIYAWKNVKNPTWSETIDSVESGECIIDGYVGSMEGDVVSVFILETGDCVKVRKEDTEEVDVDFEFTGLQTGEYTVVVKEVGEESNRGSLRFLEGGGTRAKLETYVTYDNHVTIDFRVPASKYYFSDGYGTKTVYESKLEVCSITVINFDDEVEGDEDETIDDEIYFIVDGVRYPHPISRDKLLYEGDFHYKVESLNTYMTNQRGRNHVIYSVLTTKKSDNVVVDISIFEDDSQWNNDWDYSKGFITRKDEQLDEKTTISYMSPDEFSLQNYYNMIGGNNLKYDESFICLRATTGDSDKDGKPDGEYVVVLKNSIESISNKNYRSRSRYKGWDPDGDGWSNAAEKKYGTDPYSVDSDDDGWWDNNNYQVNVKLKKVHLYDSNERDLDDEVYIIIDDVRYPYWDYDDSDWWFRVDCGDRYAWDMNTWDDDRYPNKVVATRSVNGEGLTNGQRFQFEARACESDNDWNDDWDSDDLIGKKTFNIEFNGATFLFDNGKSEYKWIPKEDNPWYKKDARYGFTFKIEVIRFGDPEPNEKYGDSDKDGITDDKEAELAMEPGNFGMDRSRFLGYANPDQKDLFVEVDHMKGHSMKEQAKYMVCTKFREAGGNDPIWLRIDRGGMGNNFNVVPSHEHLSTDSEQFGIIKWGEGRSTILEYISYNGRSWRKVLTKEYGPGAHYFTNERKYVFKYCIFGRYGPEEDEEGIDGLLGEAEGTNDDDFVIGDSQIEKFGVCITAALNDAYKSGNIMWVLTAEIISELFIPNSHAVSQAGVFMHELGHLLSLEHPSGGPDWLVPEDEEGGFGPLTHTSCMNYWYILALVQYTSSEWNKVESDYMPSHPHIFSDTD